MNQVNGPKPRPRIATGWPGYAEEGPPREVRYSDRYDVKTLTYVCDHCLDDHGRALVLRGYEHTYDDGLEEMGYECPACRRWWWTVWGYYDGTS